MIRNKRIAIRRHFTGKGIIIIEQQHIYIGSQFQMQKTTSNTEHAVHIERRVSYKYSY